MTTIKATDARAKLYKLLDEAAESHEPIQITGKRSNAVLISMDDWRSIQETLYLLSIPGMRESIRKGLKTPVEKCSESALGSNLQNSITPLSQFTESRWPFPRLFRFWLDTQFVLDRNIRLAAPNRKFPVLSGAG
jgi:antitoxin YefM